MPATMLTAPALDAANGIRHAFFTREGGVSGGIYTSLNCGPGSDDDPANVRENRRRAANRLALDETALVTLYQVHSATVVRVTAPQAVAAERPQADAMVTDRENVMLGILAADCAPVLFADAERGIIGAAHAGWRGALAGIVEQTAKAMEELGARRSAIAAAVGPCIAQDSYQVGADFPAPFVAQDPENEVFFAPDPAGDRFRFDLRGYVLHRLRAAGIGRTDAIRRDTYAEDALFFSYRRTCHRGETDYGRNLSAIALSG